MLYFGLWIGPFGFCIAVKTIALIYKPGFQAGFATYPVGEWH